jgi:hypothetical protein
MKTIVAALAVLVLAASSFGQTMSATAGAKPPRPTREPGKSSAPKSGVAPVDAMLSSINATIKTGYTSYSNYWDVAFSYQQGKLVFVFDSLTESGYGQHNIFTSVIPQLGEARYSALGDGTFGVRMYCKWRLGCWYMSTSTVPQPGGPAQTATSNQGSVAMLVAASEDKAKSITKAVNDLIRSVDAQNGVQQLPEYQGFIVRADDAANTFHANITRGFSDPNPQDARNISNTTLRSEGRRVILEFDEGRPNGTVHVVQTADANDLESVGSEWKDGLGYLANLQCKVAARCNTTFYLGANGIVRTARYDRIGPFVVPARYQNDQQQWTAATNALDGFVRAVMIEDAKQRAAFGVRAPEQVVTPINANMAKSFALPAYNARNASLLVEKGKLKLQWDTDAVTTDGAPAHEAQEAQLSDLDFVFENWSSLPGGSGYYVNFYCKHGAPCNHVTRSPSNGSGANILFDHFGPFVVAASRKNPELVDPMAGTLRELLETSGSEAPADNSASTTPEATVAYINSIRTARMVYSTASISNVALHYKNGLVSLEEDTHASNGYASHAESTVNPRDLGDIKILGPFADSGYVINAYCKTTEPCVARTWKPTALPENLVARVAPDQLNYMGWLVARDEETAQTIVKQLETMVKTAAAAEDKSQKKEGAVAGPTLDETLAYISSQLTKSFSSDGLTFSNYLFRYENGRVVLEYDILTPAQAVTRHFSQAVNVRDLDQVWYANHKNVGYTLWINCKSGAQCIETSQQTTAMPDGYTPNDAPGKGDHIGWFVIQDVEIAGRAARALDHLIKIATVQNEQADPFK